jgi:hypothetical protein
MPRQEEIDFDWGLKKFRPPFKPRYVFLFSGHMIDAPSRSEPRFPTDKEKIAAQAIAKNLDELDAGPKDLALCGGACGGDLLFAEACLNRNVHLQIRIPFDEHTFLKNSVTFAGGNWRDRYYAVKNNKLTTLFLMPKELGPTPEDANPYERDNLWQLYTALSMGPEKVRFICLGWKRGWTRRNKHMHDSVKERSGLVYVLIVFSSKKEKP